MVNYQVQYLRSRNAAPIIRDYMYEEEARLRGLEEAPEWTVQAAAE